MVIGFVAPVLFFLPLSSDGFLNMIKSHQVDYITSAGKMNRRSAEDYCKQRNLKLPLPKSKENKFEGLHSYWIRVKDVNSQWVDSETLDTVWFKMFF